MARDNWLPLDLASDVSDECLRETIDGGQAFRWEFDESTRSWSGTWGVTKIQIRRENDRLEFLASRRNAKTQRDAIKSYLAESTDWTGIRDTLPWRSDPHLGTCMEAFPDLRILKQPFPETLLAFLCSATKQIPQIKVMCANLANRFGEPIDDTTNALPTWERLSRATESELRSLALGFRAKNIKKTADIIAKDPELLSHIEAANYDDAKAGLVALPGVGEKIADCALLFGAGKLEAFPVDTWIIKVLERRYGLEGWSNSQLSEFGRIHFGKYAGYAQQFLFSWERSVR